MKTTLTLAMAAMLAFVPACGGDVMSIDDAKALFTKASGQTTQISGAFESIKDEASATAALPNLTKWMPALATSQASLKAMPSAISDKIPGFSKFGGIIDTLKAKAIEMLKNAAIKGVLGKVLGNFIK